MRAVIIGDGPEKANIARLIKKLGLSGIVELRDFYRTEKKEEVYQRISNSKLLLHMSEREGLSVIVLESLALGTPVLLPEYSPIPNEVRNMCVVTDEVNVPYMLEEMLQSKDKSKYLRNIEGLKNFSVSHTNKFYMGLFNKLRRK
jgi:glycosyltransferase involved in cell wall biosynthesis